MVLLSIVMPTRNRPDTADVCVRSLLEMNGADFEVVVRDCSDDDALEIRLRDVDDSRLIYERASATNMTDNWNKAFWLSSGQYLSFIGDDDGFLPWTLELVRALHAITPFTHLGSPEVVQYSWPGFPDRKLESSVQYNVAQFPAVVTPARGEDAIRLLLDPAKMASSSKSIYHLPSLYYGVVSRKTVNSICIDGSPFHTKVPDWFTMTMLSASVAEYYLASVPLFIIGRSGRSNTGRFVRARTDNSHAEEYGTLEGMDSMTPPVNTIEVYHFDPILKAIRAAGATDHIRTFEQKFLPMTYALSSLRNPSQAVKILCHLYNRVLRNHTFVDRIAMSGGVVFHLSKRVWQRVVQSVTSAKPSKLTQSVSGVADVSQVIQILEQTAVGWPAEQGQLVKFARPVEANEV
jgi:hypothetical protein